MSNKTAVIIAPLDTSGERIVDTVSRALREIGIAVFAPDEVRVGSNITDAIAGAIESSDFVVADISRQNPNVMYELGYAHGLRKPTLLLVNQEIRSEVPSDLAGNLYLVYDPSNLKAFRETFQSIVKDYLVGV